MIADGLIGALHRPIMQGGAKGHSIQVAHADRGGEWYAGSIMRGGRSLFAATGSGGVVRLRAAMRRKRLSPHVGGATLMEKQSWIWDVPTRIFHWSIVGLIAFSWWSASNGQMERHYYSGLLICALLIFRLSWGFVGTSTARFSQFVRGIGPVAAYLRGRATGPTVGHNPMGGWSVVAMLLVLTTQVASGLFAVDVDGLESGPLSYLLEFDQGRAAAWLHDLSFNALLVLMALHIAAVLFYLLVRRTDLIRPMITGRRAAGDGPGATRVPAWRLAAAIAVAAAATVWIAYGLYGLAA